jgi:hypothetical protein
MQEKTEEEMEGVPAQVPAGEVPAMQGKPEGFKQLWRETDLLLGFVSYAGKRGHYFLGDFDDIDVNDLVNRVFSVLIDGHRFGDVYVVRSGKGYHVLNFTNVLSLPDYVKILDEIGADKMFVKWVKKVRYGILRVSRRSSHGKVPSLECIVTSRNRLPENETAKSWYFWLLGQENSYKSVRRVRVYGNWRRKKHEMESL